MTYVDGQDIDTSCEVWADDDLNLLMVEGRGPFWACHRRRWALAVWAADAWAAARPRRGSGAHGQRGVVEGV